MIGFAGAAVLVEGDAFEVVRLDGEGRGDGVAHEFEPLALLRRAGRVRTP